MERSRHPSKPYRPATGRAVAWLALFFSLAAFLMSGATLLLTWRGGELAGRAQNMFQGLRKPAGGAPEGELAAQWARLRDKFYRAEVMIGNKDGQARQYLDGLKNDLDQLAKTSSEKGAAWVGEASAKLKTIREQAAVNGPEAIRRLRQLSTDIQQQARNLQQAGQALRALTPGAAATPAPVKPGDGLENQP